MNRCVWADSHGRLHFELLILYMQKMQEEPALYHFGNIVEKLGSGDFMLEQARVAAEEHYPASIFRAVRGDPRGGALSDPGTEHEEVLVGNRAVTRDKARAATAGKNVTDGHTLVHTQGVHTHTTHCP